MKIKQSMLLKIEQRLMKKDLKFTSDYNSHRVCIHVGINSNLTLVINGVSPKSPTHEQFKIGNVSDAINRAVEIVGIPFKLKEMS